MQGAGLNFRKDLSRRFKIGWLLGTVGLVVLLLLLAARVVDFQRAKMGAFSQLSPASGSVIYIAREIRFSWEVAKDLQSAVNKGGVRYELYVGDSPSSLRKIDSELYEPFSIVPLSKLASLFDAFQFVSGHPTPKKELEVFWKVAAILPNGKTYYSELQKITVRVNKKPAVRILRPLDNDVTTLLTTLEWTCEDEEPDRVEFQVFLGTDANNLKPLNIPIRRIDSRTFGVRLIDNHLLLSVRDYYWKVVAKDAHGETSETKIARFRTSKLVIQRIRLPHGDRTSGAVIHASPLVAADGTIYVGTLSGKLYAVKNDKSVASVFDLESGIWGSPVLLGEKEIIAVTTDGKVHAIRDNVTELVTVLPGEIRASPAVFKGLLFIATLTGELYALTRQTNGQWKALWTFRTGGEIWSSPAVDREGNVYFGSFDGYLYCVSAKGKLRWKFATGGKIWSSPALGDDGTVYFGSDDGFVYAVSKSGKLKWRFMTSSYVRSSPVVGADGTVVIGGWDNYLYAFNPSGELKWRVKLGAGVFGSALIDNFGTTYVGAWDGCIYAIAKSGRIFWRGKLKSRVDSSPTISKEGVIYFGCDDGNLYMIAPYGTLGEARHPNRVIVSLSNGPWPKFRANVANTGVVNQPE